MRLLIVGSGKGSWEMRGQQLGAALGSRVTSAPTDAEWRACDAVVLVKRAGPQHAAAAHRFGVPIVWDALDFWRQPAENGRPADQARAALRALHRAIRPALTIGATEAMAEACAELGPSAYLPHHARLGLGPTPAREAIRVVGYDGSPAYLDAWQPVLQRACATRGWTFVVNPSDLSRVDLLVALRGGLWDGWVCREWKSGVKLGNAIAAGRPILTQESAAFRELQPCGSIVSDTRDLDQALDFWADAGSRKAVVARSLTRAGDFTVEAVANRYRQVLAPLASMSGACC